MSKQSKARNKAFRAAAQQMADRYDYTTSLDPDELKEYLQDLVTRNLDEWNLVWDAAREWTEQRWRSRLVDLAEQLERDIESLQASVAGRDSEIERLQELLNQVTATAKSRLGQIRTQEEALRLSRLSNVSLVKRMDQVASTETHDLRLQLEQVIQKNVDLIRENEALLKTNKTQAGIIDQQRESNRTLFNENTRLRGERTDLQAQVNDDRAQDRELRLEKLRNANLSRRLNTAEAQLAEARALTTQGTTTVFEENERLVAKVRELEALNASLEEFNNDCMKKRDRQLAILAEEKMLTSKLRREVQQLRDEREARVRWDVEKLEQIAAPGCQVTKGHAHKCTGAHLIGYGYPHACSCGHRWYSRDMLDTPTR